MSRLGSMFGTPAPIDVEQDRRPAPGLGSMFGSRDKRAQYRTGTAQSGGGVRAQSSPAPEGVADSGMTLNATRRPGQYSSLDALMPQQTAYSPGNSSQLLANKVNVATDQQLDRRIQPYVNAKSGPRAYRGVRNGSIAVSPGQTYLASDDALTEFNQASGEPFSPQALDAGRGAVNRRSPVWQNQYAQTFGDAMQADEQRQVDYANQRVDSRLAASQGKYPTPAGREAGWFGRGWDTSMPEARPERQLTFNPAQNAAANKALYNQHLNAMMNNPEYAARVLDQRQNRRQQLEARDAIGDARRQGAIEAAGASQQLRNLMAGRGALGPGRDGFGALMSMAAMQNPNEAFGDFGQGFMALNAPNMLQQRLNADQTMQGQRLGAEQAMQGQQIGAQERMLGQELSSRRTIADLNVAAQKAQSEAERNFMAAQNATSFEQRKELEDLAYKRQRESDAYNSRLQIMMNVENPYRAKMMLGMIGDGSGQMNPDYFDPTKNPMAFTPDYQADPSMSRYDNMMKAAAQARQYGLDDQQTREYLASNGLLPDQSDINRSTYDSAVDEMPSMTGNPFLDWMARSATKSARPYVSPYIESRQQKNNLRNLVNPGQPVGGMPINPNPVGDPTRLRRMMSSGF